MATFTFAECRDEDEPMRVQRELAVTIAALLGTLPWSAHGQTEQRLAIPLSDPGRPATLDVDLLAGHILVRGYDGNEVIVIVREHADEDDDDHDDDEDEQDERGDARRREGLRRIPNTGLGLVAEERDNRVSIGTDTPLMRELELEISVPRRTSVSASTVNGGDLMIEGVTGEHELSNVNGGIFARDIAGSVVAGTTNGDVEISLNEVTADKPMSFASFNGDLDIAFPANVSADLRIAGGRGDIYTDFDVEIRPQTEVFERGGDPGRRQIRFEQEMSGVVGRGGPEFRFKTFNGDITIRKR
jgi:hypothetical protein